MEILNWLRDVSQYVAVARRRSALRQPGGGTDYTSGAFRSIVRRTVMQLHPERMHLRVQAIARETPTTKIFRLERTDGPLPPFRPGQYVNVFVDVDGVLTSRPYSMASTPGQAYLELAVRDRAGGFVAPFMLNEIQVGDVLETSGPAGNFYYEPLIDGTDLVFLAGGSGITPFMSIIRTAFSGARRPGDKADLPGPLRIHLLYGSRLVDDIIYGSELVALAAAHPGFTYTLVISEPAPGYQGLCGLLDAALIRDHVGEVAGKTFYICGPGPMYGFCDAALAELGVPAHRVRRELYGPPADVTQEPGWPRGLAAGTLFTLEVMGHGTYRAPAGEPLMNTLERYGMAVPALCRSGACSACRTRLIAGRVYMPAQTALRETDRVYGYIHPCVAFPLSDVQIRLASE